MKHLKLFNNFVNEELHEAADAGDRIKNLNAKIDALRDKLTAAKDFEEKNKIQDRIKTAMQALSDIKKSHSIKEESQISKEMVKKLPTEAQKRLAQNIKGNSSLSKINEGAHGMATKILQSVVDGDSSRAEGTKMSKELAQHFIDWIRTSPYGKKNGNLPLDMLVKASFNWGIERGLDPKLKSELAGLQETVNEGSFHVALYKARNEGAKEFEFKGQKFPVHPNKGEVEMIDEEDEKVDEGVVSIKGGRILAHKVLNKLVDMDIIPVKKKSEEAVEAVASVLATTSMAESVNEGFEVIYTNQNVRGSKKFSDRSKAMSFAKELIAQGANEVDVFNAGGNFNSSADTGAVIAWYGNGTYMDNMSKKDPKLAAKRIDESELNEGAVKKFESDIASMVKNIKSGYGWIDPEYIEETWDNIATSIDFGIAAEEICNRLIKAGLVYFPDDKDAEEKGKQVKNYSEIAKLVESLNEGAVQIAGKNKPSGAKVLATIIVDDLMKKDYLKPGADKVKSYLVDDIQDVIMNNTF
jgi:hypothetical protein